MLSNMPKRPTFSRNRNLKGSPFLLSLHSLVDRNTKALILHDKPVIILSVWKYYPNPCYFSLTLVYAFEIICFFHFTRWYVLPNECKNSYFGSAFFNIEKNFVIVQRRQICPWDFERYFKWPNLECLVIVSKIWSTYSSNDKKF